MRKRILPTFSMVLMFTTIIGLTGLQAEAALYDRGSGFIYDDSLDITWYDYSAPTLTWASAKSWADSLEVYDPLSGYTINDWRLPETYDPIQTGLTYGYDGTNTYNYGYNITSSELGHLFYEDLAGDGLYDIYGQPNNTIGIQDFNLFTSMDNYTYWSGEVPALPTYAWVFLTGNGYQQSFGKGGYSSAIAVRDGDVLGYTPNHPPVLTALENMRSMPGALLEFTLSAEDPDSEDLLTYDIENLPEGSYFDPATSTFTWIPVPGQEGNYQIEYSVCDNGLPMELDVGVVTITIGDINSAPVLTGIPAQTIHEYDTVEFTVIAEDPDGDLVDISFSALPQGAIFDTASGVFSWTPDSSQIGNYTITFVATENYFTMESDQLDVIITVGDIVSPMEFADSIINRIMDCEFPMDIKDDYVHSIQKGKGYIANSKLPPARNSIRKFKGYVENDMADSIISNEEGVLLLNMATELEEIL